MKSAYNNFKILYFVVSLAVAEIVRIQSAANIDLYVTLYTYSTADSDELVFETFSLAHMNPPSRYCGKPNIRNIDGNIHEFYFCGFKMCYSEHANKLIACERNEFKTKWVLDQVDADNSFLIRMDTLCITLKTDKSLDMQPCLNGVDINQIFHIFSAAEAQKFYFGDDVSLEKRQSKFMSVVHGDEENFRDESIANGTELD
ncbi:hypothetical protein EDEG_01392 [Edhazardia aedis USNM 41457]|uniref:Ricin B lectin domain-containing protein n=1 Tax=Edhazardia aedis (strain USNM 41457) TaxID=1003232 RepID=J9DSR3_EDHAE|nr:hypothetical protein EDEG_01392 [Edhazardia aedis USNM 41457]|eukprot:EJW04362.1 hypothetical protein EDEG_01392 [Edhazardia aedis USNM 41457]